MISEKLKQNILANAMIPEELKFALELPEGNLTEAKIKVVEKLKSGYYAENKLELRSDLEKINWDLTLVTIDRTDLSGLDFTDVNFSGATLTNIDFRMCKMTNAVFQAADVEDSDFRGTNLSGVDFSICRGRRTKFGHCELPMANFRASDLSDSDFSNSNLSGADLSDSNLSNANFIGASIAGISVQHSNLRGSDLERKEEKLLGNYDSSISGSGESRTTSYGGSGGLGGYMSSERAVYQGGRGGVYAR